jgi:hypothetical protein
LEGVNFSKTAKIHNYGKQLVLQGAAIRSKFVVDVYVGILYLEKRVASTMDAIKLPGAKRMQMSFLHEVSAKKMRSSWSAAIQDNNADDAINKHQEDITAFLNLFVHDLKPGDVVFIDNNPGQGVHVLLNNKLLGTVKNNGLYDLILATWMGKNPPSITFQKNILTFNS